MAWSISNRFAPPSRPRVSPAIRRSRFSRKAGGRGRWMRCCRPASNGIARWFEGARRPLFSVCRFAADRSRTLAAAPIGAVTREFLHAFSSVDLAGIDVPLAVQADLMQPVEITGHPAAMSESAELLQIAAIQDVNGLVGIVADIEAALRLIGREVHRHRRTWHHRLGVGFRADETLGHEAALTGFAIWIAAFLAERSILAVEHLDAIVAPVADVNLAVVGDLHAMHGIAKERRFRFALR